MEYEKVFMAIVVASASIFGIISMLNFFNLEYGTTVGDSFNSTLDRVAAIQNVTSISGSGAEATQDVEGSGSSDPQTNLITRSLRIITILPRLLGLVPDMLYSGAEILGVPPEYKDLAVGSFVFSFTLLFAYLLLIGVKRLL